ncbi:hypothetical protein B9Z55_015567 [Caenorhabditis nigoni]|uniref:Sdz-33 F-box domain-containing protein n=1 Tax=Caenorhabditis nigoni TaxID=1611254 RepID=A0A2G5UAT2_9PELO|nr:hypothetical protein B9Z55_015567 [Caenorhabditis nigoni]
MNEPPRDPKFGLLKYPFELREQVIRNMEFMDASVQFYHLYIDCYRFFSFYFSTLSKRSKQMVRSARYQTIRITFRFEKDCSMDKIEIETKKGERLKISLSDFKNPPKRDPYTLDGLELASFIKEQSDDYRKKLSAHLLFIFHFNSMEVHMGRNVKHLDDLYLWKIRKQFDSVDLIVNDGLRITPEYLKFVLNTTKAKKYFMYFKMDDLNFKYQLKDCEYLDVGGSIQWLDTDDFLKRNPQIICFTLDDLPGKQVNDLLKQWINGQVSGLESMEFFNSVGYPDDVIFDGILTKETKLTYVIIEESLMEIEMIMIKVQVIISPNFSERNKLMIYLECGIMTEQQ